MDDYKEFSDLSGCAKFFAWIAAILLAIAIIFVVL